MKGTMQEPEVTLELARQHGLSEEEYEQIQKLIGRKPNYTELGMFSVMWSEHCSYKNSILLLKTLPKDGEYVLAKAGEENAGLVDIGDGLAVAFKIESHNHPSAVEPYQGAATGVGGILRDIFSMGARPVAALNSLRFGSLDDPHVRYLFRGVVHGIGDYGNCFGVPTVAGEVYFDPSYRGNPLVNAMAVGIVKHDRIVRAVARGEGARVFLIGSSTGRDGIHGATFASEDLSEESEAKRPQVQVGDPFTEKLLLEATLEMAKEDCVIGIQDMGAAGITCSTSEMSAAGHAGMVIELDKVPLREADMIPYEILLSESQERMLVVAKPGKEEKIKQICEKWDLHAAEIGKVTERNQQLQVFWHGKKVVDIPADSLVVGGGAPQYERESRRPEYIERLHGEDLRALPHPLDLADTLLKLLESPNIANKSWVYHQYDHTVRTNTVVAPGADAAVIRIKGTKKGLAMKTDCNSRYVYLNPRRGTAIAVAESARNVVCAGGEPVAITNCLNFGNPYNPEIYWQFKEAIAGMREACSYLGTPVTGGNVSFYNENPDGAIHPTPTIGMLGILEDINHATTAWFKQEGDLIVLLGRNLEEVGGSEYLAVIHGKVSGDCPQLDLQRELQVQTACLKAIREGLVQSAHDVADGGVAVALAESCIMNRERPLGASVELTGYFRADFCLFGESQSQIVLSLKGAHLPRLTEICNEYNVAMRVIGEVGGERLRIGELVDVSLQDMMDRYYNAIPEKMRIVAIE
ncbi:MAG: phosphoribosylformylglycinamidine synthase subunit PurL [candidate division KSB1 bacterium]|nr:phosphoribosylformylglycinamidine synthase subunit PurL [candidate division KSB1 bacterium]